MTLHKAEQIWLDQTTEEEVWFAQFPEPCQLRRPNTGMPALASLKFGQYRDFSDQQIADDRVIWLAMIMSERSGDGARLLGQIRKLATTSGLAICGDPVPLKPANWDPQRHWPSRTNRLIAWYLEQDFRVVQSKRQTRVWHLPPGLQISVQFEL